MTKTVRLPNGVTCVTDERPQSGKVSMHVVIKSGSMHEAPEENGLTFLMQESCNGGTTTRSRDEIIQSIESKGGSISSTTLRAATTFGATALTRYTDETFDILADVVRNPAFNFLEVMKTKFQISQWIKEQDVSPVNRSGQKFLETAFQGQSVGKRPAGTEDLLQSFTPNQVRQKHAEIIAQPENIVVSFAGDITSAQAEKLTRKYFGDIPAALPKIENPIVFTPGEFRENADNEQLNITLGFQAPARNTLDEYAGMILQEYLSGGVSTFLFKEIRVNRGLAYSVKAAYFPMETTGFFTIWAGTGKQNARELVSSVVDILGGIARNGVNDKALEKARKRIVKSVKTDTETLSGAMIKNATDFLTSGKIVPVEALESCLGQVTSEDVRRVCADMIKEGKYVLSAVGPLDALPLEKDIKEMMQSQMRGIEVPEPRALQATTQGDFSSASKKEDKTYSFPRETTLKNGIKVVSEQRPGTLTCGAWVGVGADHETLELNGVTHMNEHMMFKGTPSYASGIIDEIVEGELYGDLNAYTSKDNTFYFLTSLDAEALDKAVDICGEMIFKANLSHDEYVGKNGGKGERDVVIEEIGRSKDNIDHFSLSQLFQTAYPDQSHGRTLLGTAEGLRAVTAQQLAAYRDEFYVPNNVVFAATGPIKHEDFVALIDKKYGDMPAKDFPPLPVPTYIGGATYVEHASAELCNVALAADAVSRVDPLSPAYLIFGEILGNGQSSRLYKEIVVDKELSGSAEAGIADYKNAGVVFIGGSVSAKNVKPFVNTVYAEIRKMADNVSQAELDRAKMCLEMDLLTETESNLAVCEAHGSNTLAFGRLVTSEEVLEKVRRLTVDDIKAVAAKVLESNPTLSMVVPKGTNPKFLPKYEEVVAMRDAVPKAENSPVIKHKMS